MGRAPALRGRARRPPGRRPRDADRIDSVGVDSWAVDFGLLDARGRLVQNPVHYRDSTPRPSSFQTVLSEIPARELYDRTGIQLIPINTIFELAAMAEERDPALDVAQQLLMVPDLVHYWLCGARATEFTNATTTQCLDAAERTWAVDLLERLDVPAHLPAELVGPGTILGPLAADVAEETGLRDVRVIAPATHDTASAVVGAPLRRPGSAYISAGTWSLVGLEVDRPVIDDRTFAANLTNEGGVGGRYRLLRNVTGLWLLHECRRAWAAQGRDYAFDELVALARDAPPLRALVDPDDALFAAPGDMPRRIRDYCAAHRTGARRPTPLPSRAASSRASPSSTGRRSSCCATRPATRRRRCTSSAAASQNELLCQWTADAAGIPVLAGPAEATEVGNLVVQAIALGELSSRRRKDASSSRRRSRSGSTSRARRRHGATRASGSRSSSRSRRSARGSRREHGRAPHRDRAAGRPLGSRRRSRADRASPRSSTARTCSAPTGRSPTRAAGTPR